MKSTIRINRHACALIFSPYIYMNCLGRRRGIHCREGKQISMSLFLDIVCQSLGFRSTEGTGVQPRLFIGNDCQELEGAIG